MSESGSSPTDKKEMHLEREITINAPVETVWKALTDANELTKWFPLSARVTPGKGGKIFLSWGPSCEGEADIIAWEPNKKFACKEPLAVIEWTLESRGGKTVVRLVQSGFASGVDWENEWFESTDYGWGFMLLSLRWALEVHPGATRQVVWPRQATEVTRPQAYSKLLSPGALFREGASNLGPGDSFRVTTPSGECWTGTTQFARQGRGFCLSVKELNNSLFWVTIEGTPGEIEAQIWLSSFGLPEEKLRAFEGFWKNKLQEIFPDRKN